MKYFTLDVIYTIVNWRCDTKQLILQPSKASHYQYINKNPRCLLTTGLRIEYDNLEMVKYLHDKGHEITVETIHWAKECNANSVYEWLKSDLSKIKNVYRSEVYLATDMEDIVLLKYLH